MQGKNRSIKRHERHRHMQRVTWVSTAVDLLLAFIKLAVGFSVRSPALIADGIHSLSDLLTDGFVLFINRVSHTAPDSDHPYGHARFESAGTLLMGFVLCLVAVGLAWDNIIRLLSDQPVAQASIWAIAVAAASLLIKEGLFFYGRHWATKLDSELLHANAWHSRSDSLSSLVVLTGVVATWFGYPWLEGWAALLVAALIGKMGAELAWHALQKLADRGLPADTRKALRDSIMQVPGVLGLHELRSRHMGNQVFIDAHIQVHNFITISEGHQISDWIARRLHLEFPELGDITLHIDPEDDQQQDKQTLAPLRGEIETAISTYSALSACCRMQIHYRRQHVLLELYFDNEPRPDCFRQRNQALADLPWLAGIELHRIYNTDRSKRATDAGYTDAD